MLANIVAVLVARPQLAVHDRRLHLLRRWGLLVLLSRRREAHQLVGRVVKLGWRRQRASTWPLLLLWWCWDGILVALARLGIHDDG